MRRIRNDEAERQVLQDVRSEDGGDHMIDIIMDGMCDGCQQADLRLECLDIEALGDFDCIKEWRIYCTHQQACEAMRRKMREVTI